MFVDIKFVADSANCGANDAQPSRKQSQAENNACTKGKDMYRRTIAALVLIVASADAHYDVSCRGGIAEDQLFLLLCVVAVCVFYYNNSATK